MNILAALALPVAAVLGLAFLSSQVIASRAAAEFPPIGQFRTVDGSRLHFVDRPAAEADAPVLVFLHGASANLRDQLEVFRPAFEDRYRTIFIDRPGHGWSDRNVSAHLTPSGQARLIAGLLGDLGVEEAVLVGHSFGGAIVAAFAVHHPARTAGLVFLAPATHSWPGGVSWFYDVAATPVVGPVFASTIVPVAGIFSLEAAVEGVFAPNPVPDDYIERTGPQLVLRPSAFLANAFDVTNLLEEVKRLSPRYREIVAPTAIVTGDSDGVVYPSIHSAGLHRDIAGSTLTVLDGIGHKPDWSATAASIEAIETVVRRSLEERGRIDPPARRDPAAPAYTADNPSEPI